VVFNQKEDPKFKENIKRLGKLFNQDSIGYIPKYSRVFYLIYTNISNGINKYGSTIKIGDFIATGNKVGDYFSKINGRKFAFESKEENRYGWKKPEQLEDIIEINNCCYINDPDVGIGKENFNKIRETIRNMKIKNYLKQIGLL